MSATLRPYPRHVIVLLDWAEREFPALAGGRHTGTEAPTDLADLLPFLAVAAVGGDATRLDAHPLLDFDVFARSKTEAEGLAFALNARLMEYPHRVESGERFVVIDEVINTRYPVELPWADSGVRRFGSTYQLTFRR
jgi:hypothetical protein